MQLLSPLLFATSALAMALEPRQLGGGPNESPSGTGWSRGWGDSSLTAPSNYRAVRGSGCSYTVSFTRDVDDNKYNLAYYSIFGSGDLERQQQERPSSLQWLNQNGGVGTYEAKIDDACSRFYTDRRAPRGFKIYFTPKNGGREGYHSGVFSVSG